MDAPITDIVFVSSKSGCPEGYSLVAETPCHHDAQLWEKMIGGKDGKRYICFSKTDKDGTIVEDMYIPKRSAQYVKKGYKIVKKTLEGDDPMYHKQMGLKRTPRSAAKMAVIDVIVCRSGDSVSQSYQRLDKVNGLCICFSQKPFNAAEFDKVSRRGSESSLPVVKTFPADDRPRAATVYAAPSSRYERPHMSALGENMEHLTLTNEDYDSDDHHYSPPVSREGSPLPSYVSPPPSSYDPYQDVATTAPTIPLGSAPPPQGHSHPHDSRDGGYHQPSPQPPPSASYSYSGPYPSQAPPPSGQAPPPSTQTYPPSVGPTGRYVTTSPSYPPTTAGYYAGATPTYPPPTTNPYPAQQTGTGPSLGFGYGYGPAPPANYAAVAGSSFSGVAVPTGAGGPAPYNPYAHQSQPPATAAPSYPSQQQPGQNIGFKF